MTKKLERSSSPRHVNIYDEDWEFLESVYGRFSTSKYGVARATREIIHNWVKRLKARAESEAESELPKEAQK